MAADRGRAASPTRAPRLHVSPHACGSALRLATLTEHSRFLYSEGMFRRKTLFIVGAGASCEAGLPSGHTLKGVVANMLNISGIRDGDRRVRDAINMSAATLDGPHVREHLAAATYAIRNAMPLAISIDNFLDAHQGDEAIELCGKIAIAKAVLDAEQNSLLFYPDPETSFDVGGLAETWYVRFAQLLMEGVRRSDIAKAIENVSIITFNYDRCIEHFLRQAFMTYYRIKPSDAETLVARIPIKHPYGQVGRLDWEDGDEGVGFGMPEAADLLRLSRQIRTFTERVEDEAAIGTIHDLVDQAETIVFLGFAYHLQNLRLLTPPSRSPRRRKRIFGTTLGVSESDVQAISGDVAHMFPITASTGEPYDHSKLTAVPLHCNNFLSAYGRTLTAP